MSKDKRAAMLAQWLDLLLIMRRALIMQLRAIDAILIAHGRLRRPTLPDEKEGHG